MNLTPTESAALADRAQFEGNENLADAVNAETLSAKRQAMDRALRWFDIAANLQGGDRVLT